jgi:hypothetical protein
MLGLSFPLLQRAPAQQTTPQDSTPAAAASPSDTQQINGPAIRASRDLSAAISREAQATRAQQIALDQVDQLRTQIAQTDAAMAAQKTKMAPASSPPTTQSAADAEQLIKLQQDGLDERSKLAFQLENAHTAYVAAMEARMAVADSQRRLWAAYGINTAPTTQPGQAAMQGQMVPPTEPTVIGPNGYVVNPPPATEQQVPYNGQDNGYYDNGYSQAEYSGPAYAPTTSGTDDTYNNPYYYGASSPYYNPGYYGGYYGYGPYYGGYPFWPFFGYVYINNHHHDDHHWNGNWSHDSARVGSEAHVAAPAAQRSESHSAPAFSHFGGGGGFHGGFGGGHR